MLSKNDEAKMVLYNALPKKDYERIFMCKTAKDVWNSLVITHQGNKQVKDNKIDLFVQQYEQFIIFDDETIDCAFARFNTIVTFLKALDESFSSRNHVRKFLRALPTKWRPKVTTIEESKDLSTLLLGELRVSSDEEVSCSDSDDEEYAMAVRDFKKFFRRRGKFIRQPHDDKKTFRKAKEEKEGREERRCFKYGDLNHFISDCPKHSYNDKKAFVGGCWSDSEKEDDSKKDEIYLMAHDTNEGLGFTEDKDSTSEAKTGKMGQESNKVPSEEPAHTVPSAMVPPSKNAGYRGIVLAKEILEPILQNRNEFVQVTKKTLPSASVGNVKQTPTLKLGQRLGESKIQTRPKTPLGDLTIYTLRATTIK
ncbi:hypothetical protein Tco_1311063 [Tanacetum coccineum]